MSFASPLAKRKGTNAAASPASKPVPAVIAAPKNTGPKSTFKFKCSYKNTIYDVLRGRGWIETDGEDWDIMWGDKEWIRDHFDEVHFTDSQRINHFRNHYELTRKDNLIKNLKRTKRQLDKEDNPEEAGKYSFFPSSYLLPADYTLFVEEWKKHPPGTLWIMKPAGKAQGKGIFLFNKLSQISNWKNTYRQQQEGGQPAELYIVQQYIENPYLVGGKKFDMRIYVLVTSYYPLKIYLHRSAFARFSNHRYNLSVNDLSNMYVHLTNVAIQRTSKNYNASGCKWDVKNLKLFMIAKHGMEAVSNMFAGIQQLIVKSLQAVQRVLINDRHCFELYGYDILLDGNLKPWLLEVNGAPSLSADTVRDHELKYGVLDDTLTVIDMEKKLQGNEEHIGGFDLIYDQATGYCPKQCFLGCYVKPPVITGPRTIGKPAPPQHAQAMAATGGVPQPVN